jgi:hypothetical protein
MSDETENKGSGQAAARFQIYRASDARNYAEHNVMSMDAITPVAAQGLGHFQGAGEGDGQLVRLLFATPGFSLTHVWFKSGYPLPLHSHNSDCLYYIVAGSLQVGRETLGVGDGFFIRRNVAYTYVPGPQGVEVLEFRNTDNFNIRFRSDSQAVWEQAAAILAAHREAWSREPPPSQSRG